jgi:hypothetical protein
MLNFDQPLKIYLHKVAQAVDFAIRINDHHVHTYRLPVNIFESMIQHWHVPGGYKFECHTFRWMIEHKTTGPRPQMLPADYVKISIGGQGQDFHYRVNYSDMQEIARNFLHQQTHAMYWD